MDSEHIMNGNKRNAYRVFVEKPERKRPLRRPISEWEDIIKMDIRELGWSGMDCIDLAQDMNQQKIPLNIIMNLWGP
jgi:hypothetical protein